MDPDVFYWAHATFFKGMLLTAEHFMGGLTEAQRRQLFEEHKIWYRLYGVSERAMPQTWEEFQAYWDHMCRDVLEDNAAARGVLDLHDIGKPPFVHWIPEPAWPLLRPFVAHGFVWLTVGLMDPPVREKLGYRWTGIDAGLHRRVGQAVNLGAKFVPRRRLMHPPRNTPSTDSPAVSPPTHRRATRRAGTCRRRTSGTIPSTTTRTGRSLRHVARISSDAPISLGGPPVASPATVITPVWPPTCAVITLVWPRFPGVGGHSGVITTARGAVSGREPPLPSESTCGRPLAPRALTSAPYATSHSHPYLSASCLTAWSLACQSK